MKSPIVNGEWIHQEGDKYLVIGKDQVGQRIRIEAVVWAYAKGINIWQGNKYLVRNGKRYLIQRITN